MKHTLGLICMLAVFVVAPLCASSSPDVRQDGRTLWMVNHADGCDDCSVIQIWSMNNAVTMFRVTIVFSDGSRAVRTSERNVPESGLPYGQPSVVLVRGSMKGATVSIAAFGQPIEQTTPADTGSN